jgi:hypothetical protein
MMSDAQTLAQPATDGTDPPQAPAWKLGSDVPPEECQAIQPLLKRLSRLHRELDRLERELDAIKDA